MQCHPLRATLLNIAYGKRVASYKDVGYFPHIHYPSRLPKDACRRLKLTVLSKCLDVLLGTMKKQSKDGKNAFRLCLTGQVSHSECVLYCTTGVLLTDPWGRQRQVFPQLFSYVTDDPEAKDLSCIRGGTAGHSCEFCLVPRLSLHDLSREWEPRTESVSKLLVEEALGLATRAQREAFCKEHSIHPVISGLFGFFAGSTKKGSAMQCFTVESMHVEDLGVFLYIIDYITVRARFWMGCAIPSDCYPVFPTLLIYSIIAAADCNSLPSFVS